MKNRILKQFCNNLIKTSAILGLMMSSVHAGNGMERSLSSSVDNQRMASMVTSMKNWNKVKNKGKHVHFNDKVIYSDDVPNTTDGVATPVNGEALVNCGTFSAVQTINLAGKLEKIIMRGSLEFAKQAQKAAKVGKKAMILSGKAVGKAAVKAGKFVAAESVKAGRFAAKGAVKTGKFVAKESAKAKEYLKELVAIESRNVDMSRLVELLKSSEKTYNLVEFLNNYSIKMGEKFRELEKLDRLQKLQDTRTKRAEEESIDKKNSVKKIAGHVVKVVKNNAKSLRKALVGKFSDWAYMLSMHTYNNYLKIVNEYNKKRDAFYNKYDS